MGTAFFQRSELDLSALSHFSAGGQLLHPSEVKSSMSELCMSPLSNVFGPAAKMLPAASQITITTAAITRRLISLISHATAAIIFRRIAQRPSGPADDHRLAVRWQ